MNRFSKEKETKIKDKAPPPKKKRRCCFDFQRTDAGGATIGSAVDGKEKPTPSVAEPSLMRFKSRAVLESVPIGRSTTSPPPQIAVVMTSVCIDEAEVLQKGLGVGPLTLYASFP